MLNSVWGLFWLYSINSRTKLSIIIVTILLLDHASAASDSSSHSVKSQPAYNIVFILTDNQSSEALSVYGNKDVNMPNIDALAKSGVTFDNAFSVSGMCSPTRATLMTGLIPSQHGLHNALHDEWVDERDAGWSAVQEFRTLPYTLANNGYQTAMVGKWHIGDPKKPQLGFQHWVALPYGHTKDFWHNQLVVNGAIQNVDDRHIVDVLAEHAVEYIDNVNNDSPFFLYLSLDGPYSLPPTNYGPARNRHYRGYEQAHFQSMPEQPVSDDILQVLNGPFVLEHAIENGIDDLSLEEIWDSLRYRTIRMQGDRESYANFLSQNTIVDDAVGEVLKSLEKNGLADNTIVIYSADQGNLYGQHGTWGHTIWTTPAHLYDVAMKVPLIIAHPAVANGLRSNKMIGQYDMAPTMLAMAGLSHITFDKSPGRSFFSLDGKMLKTLEDGEFVFFEQEESRGLRTSEYAYWKRLTGFGNNALYAVRIDAEQKKNLIDDPEYEDIIAELDSRLDTFFARTAEPEYDLWRGAVSKGTMPKPKMWIAFKPWPWLKKFWRDYVTDPLIKKNYDYSSDH